MDFDARGVEVLTWCLVNVMDVHTCLITEGLLFGLLIVQKVHKNPQVSKLNIFTDISSSSAILSDNLVPAIRNLGKYAEYERFLVKGGVLKTTETGSAVGSCVNRGLCLGYNFLGFIFRHVVLQRTMRYICLPDNLHDKAFCCEIFENR